jgi:molecular chaperone GrpE
MYPQPEAPDQYLHQPRAQEVDSPEDKSDSADVRARLMRRFEVWLDEALADESAPEGLTKDILERLQTDENPANEPQSSDLYSLCSALTALTAETHMQERSFKELQEGMGQIKDSISELHNAPSPVQPLVESVESLLQRDDRVLEQKLEQDLESARQDTIKTALDVLIDLRDELVHAVDTARTPIEAPRPANRTGLLAKLRPAGAPPVQETNPALIKELEMAVNRIDEALQHWHVAPIPCMGQAFDPQTMQAVGMTDTTDAPDNTVLGVCRTGYRWDEKVYRIAKVKLARNQAKASDS